MKKKKSALILIVLVIIFLVLFGFFLKDILGNQNEEVNQSLETETDEEPTTEVIEEESEEQEPEEIVYELVSEKKTNANGEVVVDYQYPVFHANVSLYKTVVERINHDYPRFITESNLVDTDSEEEYEEETEDEDECECGHHHHYEEGEGEDDIFTGDIFKDFHDDN